ncbi:MAG: copper chaperone PCu(A)C [Pseudomonadota bacterium]
MLTKSSLRFAAITAWAAIPFKLYSSGYGRFLLGPRDAFGGALQRRLARRYKTSMPQFSARTEATSWYAPFLIAVLAGSTSGLAVADTDQTTLTLSEPWVRAMPPSRSSTAAYLTVSNNSDQPVSITGVSSPDANATLHETVTRDGRSLMQPVDELVVPAKSSVSLAPGGLHIMLMGLAPMPSAGESVAVCLQTAGGDTCADARVQRNAPSAHREAQQKAE